MQESVRKTLKDAGGCQEDIDLMLPIAWLLSMPSLK
jgi:hypothetical protein